MVRQHPDCSPCCCCCHCLPMVRQHPSGLQYPALAGIQLIGLRPAGLSMPAKAGYRQRQTYLLRRDAVPVATAVDCSPYPTLGQHCSRTDGLVTFIQLSNLFDCSRIPLVSSPLLLHSIVRKKKIYGTHTTERL